MLACLMLSACGERTQASSEPVARVNGSMISMHQLDQQLVQVSTPDHVRQSMLDKLIDRQLLRGEAVRAGIDRDPQVSAAIERAKNEILAQAYLQHRALQGWRPSPDEIAEYFKRHPEAFAQRKIFELDELAIAAERLDDGLKSVVDAAHTLDDVAVWLEGRRIAHVISRSMRSADQLPEGLASKLRDIEAGRVFVVRDGANALVMSIAAVEESPLSLAAATPQIENLLIDARLRETEQAEIARLRQQAQIEYLHRTPTRLAGAQPEVIQSGSAGLSKGHGWHAGAQNWK